MEHKAISLDTRVKGMSYGLLLCDTFPGAFLAAEILCAFQYFTPVKVISHLKGMTSEWPSVIALFIIGFVVGTLCGFVLDGIHHFVPPLRRLEDESDDSMYKAISTYEQLLIYKYLIEDDLRQPAWAYANICLAMIPGLALMPCILWKMNVPCWFILMGEASWAFIVWVMYAQFKYTTRLLNEVEKYLADNFEEEKRKNSSTPCTGEQRKGESTPHNPDSNGAA